MIYLKEIPVGGAYIWLAVTLALPPILNFVITYTHTDRAAAK